MSTKLIRAVMEGGLSNADHLQTFWEERYDGKKYWEAAYETKLKGLVRNLKGTNRCLILRVKIIGAWLSIHDTTFLGAVLSATEFRDLLCACYNISPLNLQSHCGRCGTAFRVTQ